MEIIEPALSESFERKNVNYVNSNLKRSIIRGRRTQWCPDRLMFLFIWSNDRKYLTPTNKEGRI